jgi:hypothetical protein
MKPIESTYQVARYLFRYGYLPYVTSKASQVPLDKLVASWKVVKSRVKESLVKSVDDGCRDAIIKRAIELLQRTYGLPITGEFDEATKTLCETSRCGHTDLPLILAQENAPEASNLCQWPMVDISYAFRLNFTRSNLPADAIERAFVEGVEEWNKVCGLKMFRIDDLNRANVWAVDARIDGPGGVLAQAWLPCGTVRPTTRLKQEYDQENWSFAKLREVIIHELGHSLGLRHFVVTNPERGSVMHPQATGNWPIPQAVDIQEVVRRYGPAAPRLDPNTPVPTIEGQWDNGERKFKVNQDGVRFQATSDLGGFSGEFLTPSTIELRTSGGTFTGQIEGSPIPNRISWNNDSIWTRVGVAPPPDTPSPTPDEPIKVQGTIFINGVAYKLTRESTEFGGLG